MKHGSVRERWEAALPSAAGPEWSAPALSRCGGRPAQGYCLTLREEMPATAAIIMLAPINASSRTMSGGIPMSSRAISASNSAVAHGGDRQSQNHIDRSVHVVTITWSLRMSLG